VIGGGNLAAHEISHISQFIYFTNQFCRKFVRKSISRILAKKHWTNKI